MHRYEDEGKEKDPEDQKLRDLNREVNEEMGADFATGSLMDKGREQGEHQEAETKSMSSSLGWVSLVFAIASWFIWPVLLGITSVVLGYVAYRQGARKLGAWSIAIGLIAAMVYLFIIPLYYAVT